MAVNNNGNVKYTVAYMECLHNHATQNMHYIVDGCGQFEANGPNGTLEAMFCAACNCHRSFHKTVLVELPLQFNTHGTRMDAVCAPPPHPQTSMTPAHQETHSNSNHTHFPVIEMNQRPQPAQNHTRTRLTQEQNERLRSLAESNNWMMFREYSKEEVARICSEIGITKRTLKGWINNQRHKRMARMQATVSTHERA